MFKNNIILELNDISYYENYGMTKSLEFAKTLTDENYDDINFYLYWIGNNVNYKHNVVIKSFLATQNLTKCKLIIYSDVNLENNIIFDEFKKFKDNIEFRIFDVYKEVKNTILENFKHLSKIKNHELNPALESDFFRLLILNKYGGLYCDFDILFLRDLSPLLKYEFVYKWENYNACPYLNGAVMRLYKNSDISTQMITEMIKTYPSIRSLCWASDVYCSVANYNQNLIVFPASFFNPEWQLSIPIDGFGIYKYSNELFDGSFTWHWHNRWEYNIEKNSKFDILDCIISEKLKNKFL